MLGRGISWPCSIDQPCPSCLGFYPAGGSTWDRPCSGSAAHLPARFHHAAQLPTAGHRVRDRLAGQESYSEALWWDLTVHLVLELISTPLLVKLEKCHFGWCVFEFLDVCGLPEKLCWQLIYMYTCVCVFIHIYIYTNMRCFGSLSRWNVLSYILSSCTFSVFFCDFLWISWEKI